MCLVNKFIFIKHLNYFFNFLSGLLLNSDWFTCGFKYLSANNVTIFMIFELKSFNFINYSLSLNQICFICFKLSLKEWVYEIQRSILDNLFFINIPNRFPSINFLAYHKEFGIWLGVSLEPGFVQIWRFYFNLKPGKYQQERHQEMGRIMIFVLHWHLKQRPQAPSQKCQ